MYDNFNLDFINHGTHGNIYYICNLMVIHEGYCTTHTNDGYDVTWSLHGGTEERRPMGGAPRRQGLARPCQPMPRCRGIALLHGRQYFLSLFTGDRAPGAETEICYSRKKT